MHLSPNGETNPFCRPDKLKPKLKWKAKKFYPQNLKSRLPTFHPPPRKTHGKVKGQRVESARVGENLIRMRIGNAGRKLRSAERFRQKIWQEKREKRENRRHAKCTGKRNYGEMMMMTGYTKKGNRREIEEKIINQPCTTAGT